jgi:excisionase family DNA binding protein
MNEKSLDELKEELRTQLLAMHSVTSKIMDLERELSERVDAINYKYRHNYDTEGLTLDVQAVAKSLNCGKEVAYNLVKSGEFPVFWVGNRARIPTRPFLEWAETKTDGRVFDNK